MRRIERFRADHSGAAMLELAIGIPVLLLLLFGAVDMGRVFYEADTLAGAAIAGTQFGAALQTNNNNFAGMRQAALNDANGISGVTADATSYCECLDGTSVSCSGTCGGTLPPQYIKVTASAPFSTLFLSRLIPSSMSLQAVSVERLQ